jgi:secondary thiamine-phosphate synthase enzyme
MAVFTQKQVYELSGRMSTIVLDDHVREVVARSGVHEGYVMVFVAGCVAALAITEAEPGIMNHDLDHLFSKALGTPYGAGFGDGTPYRHHETWHDDNGASHMRAVLLHHSFSIPVLNDEVLLGPWQSVLLVECDTGPRTRTVWYQVQGE